MSLNAATDATFHSMVMLATRITSPIFSVSVAISSRNSAGVPAFIMMRAGAFGSAQARGPQLALSLSKGPARGYRAASRTIAAHFSPIMIEGALVLPATIEGMTEASATRRPSMP
jgi:hypothetical protein